MKEKRKFGRRYILREEREETEESDGGIIRPEAPELTRHFSRTLMVLGNSSLSGHRYFQK